MVFIPFCLNDSWTGRGQFLKSIGSDASKTGCFQFVDLEEGFKKISNFVTVLRPQFRTLKFVGPNPLVPYGVDVLLP